MTLVRGFETPAAAWDQDSTWQLNLTNTDFEPGDPEVGMTFMVPPSGRVLIIVGGGGRNNGDDARVFMFPRLFVGTLPVPANQITDPVFRDLNVPGEADESIYGSYMSIYGNLTPLRVHYAQHTQRVGGNNTADIFVREILVVPLP